jgi:hypothetical protein
MQMLDRDYQNNILETMAGVQNDSHDEEAPRRRRSDVAPPGYPSEKAMHTLYDEIPQGSPTKELFADMCAYATNLDEHRKPDFRRLPLDAFVDVLNAIQWKD